MASPDSSQVAIIGGGLCGLALAIALRSRSIPFTVYEARSSFTELGAGINVGPNSLQAFKLIDESLGDEFFKLAARNPPGKEDVWFQLRYGASSGPFKDGDLITELMAPPTGNITIGRNALLQLLAEKAGLNEGSGRDNAKFNKKLSRLDQSQDGVTLHFDDGTQELATIVIACDGIHSAVRRALLGSDSPAAIPQYSHAGVYRALLSIPDLEKVLGYDLARTSQVYPGPRGYLIMYPTTGDTMNTGFWVCKEGSWDHREWMIPSQKEGLERDFSDWGETVHKIMDMVEDPPFFATHYHAVQPQTHYSGRVCLIGDAAHSMPPHAGAGAGQAMEDAYVIAEVLRSINRQQVGQSQIEAAFKAYEIVRRPRSQNILDESVNGMAAWSDLYNTPLDEDRVAQWVKLANDRFKPIWHHDLVADAERAVEMVREART